MSTDKISRAAPRNLHLAIATSLLLGSSVVAGCDAGGIVTLAGGSGGDGPTSTGADTSASTGAASTSTASTTVAATGSTSTGVGGAGGDGGSGAGGNGDGGSGIGGSGDGGAGGRGGSGGAGGAECGPNVTLCGDVCVDLDLDPENCGDCSVTCESGEVCSDGQCGLECVGNTTLCGASCKDLQSDRANCGECDFSCAVRAICTDGLCSEAPTVVSTIPTDGAVGVAIDRRVEATFSTIMDPITIDGSTFTVTDGASSIAGEVTYSGTTATFTPDVDYPLDTLLTATITTAAEDLAGQGLIEDYVWTFETGAEVGQLGIALGDAGPYAILAFNTVTNVNNVGTIVTGDLGISPGAALVGFPPGVVNGDIHAGDVAAADAKVDLLSAYNDASGRLGAAVLPGDLSGLTIAPGLYSNETSVMLSAGNVTLDAQGDANAVFIFQMGTTLTTNPGTAIILSGGALARNVYWAVGTSATIGTTSAFQGTVLAQSAITMNTGASLNGRILALGAAVSLDTNLITVPLP